MHEPVGEIAWLRGRMGALPVQRRIVLERAGLIDPESLDDYILTDGYVGTRQSSNKDVPCKSN